MKHWSRDYEKGWEVTVYRPRQVQMAFRNGIMPSWTATAEIDKAGRYRRTQKDADALNDLSPGTRVTLGQKGIENTIIIAPELEATARPVSESTDGTPRIRCRPDHFRPITFKLASRTGSRKSAPTNCFSSRAMQIEARNRALRIPNSLLVTCIATPRPANHHTASSNRLAQMASRIGWQPARAHTLRRASPSPFSPVSIYELPSSSRANSRLQSSSTIDPMLKALHRSSSLNAPAEYLRTIPAASHSEGLSGACRL